MKFPDATAARLFCKMAAEEMIPRRLEGGGGGRLCPFSDHTSGSCDVLVLMMMKQNTITFQTPFA